LLSIIWRFDLDGVSLDYIAVGMMTLRQREREIDMVEEMEQLLNAAHKLDDGVEPKELRKLNQKLARHGGYSDMAALNADVEAQRRKRMTRKMRAEAQERLNAMFVVDIEQERKRRRLLAEDLAAKPVYAKGRVVLE
jgi:cell division protein ZapA (FtsZ GTPase activity inhibitor)